MAEGSLRWGSHMSLHIFHLYFSLYLHLSIFSVHPAINIIWNVYIKKYVSATKVNALLNIYRDQFYHLKCFHLIKETSRHLPLCIKIPRPIDNVNVCSADENVTPGHVYVHFPCYFYTKKVDFLYPILLSHFTLNGTRKWKAKMGVCPWIRQYDRSEMIPI